MSDIVATPQSEFLQKTEEVLRTVLETGDFDYGFEFVNSLLDGKKVIDKSVSVVLDGMEEIWKPEEHEGETFLAAAVRRTGLSPETIRRHTRIQDLLNSGVIPEKFQEDIEELDSKAKRDIANMVDGGMELSEDDWQRLAEAGMAGDKAVRREIQKIKGVAPRSNYLAITIDERGILVAHTASDHVEFGRLDVFSEDPAVKKAITRMTTCAGVLDSVRY